VGLRYNLGIAYVHIFNDGRFNNSMWVFKVCFSIWVPKASIVRYIHWNNSILYHDMGIVMGTPSHNIDLKKTMYVLHFGFLFNDECL
jgi:hypothetical protein